jgi:hypothetical protein
MPNSCAQERGVQNVSLLADVSYGKKIFLFWELGDRILAHRCVRVSDKMGVATGEGGCGLRSIGSGIEPVVFSIVTGNPSLTLRVLFCGIPR